MPIVNCEQIKKGCPKCGCDKSRVEYWNCGPVVFILCPQCRYHIREGTDAPIGRLFEAWNNLPLDNRTRG